MRSSPVNRPIQDSSRVSSEIALRLSAALLLDAPSDWRSPASSDHGCCGVSSPLEMPLQVPCDVTAWMLPTWIVVVVLAFADGSAAYKSATEVGLQSEGAAADAVAAVSAAECLLTRALPARTSRGVAMAFSTGCGGGRRGLGGGLGAGGGGGGGDGGDGTCGGKGCGGGSGLQLIRGGWAELSSHAA